MTTLPLRSVAYKRYVLALFTAMVAWNGLERISLGLMLPGIKADFQLTDTQLGLLGGISFALFYAVMGIPIARWADRGNRVTILTLSWLLWSVTMALCGMVGSFIQLLIVRIGVGVGEAGCHPVSLSLIADYFNRAERPRAVAIWGGVGATFASILGFFGAGWLIELHGWRTTFWLLAIPGLALAALARLTLREPRENKAKHIVTGDGPFATSPAAPPSFRVVCITLWARRSFRHLVMCLSLAIFFNVGIAQWSATYFTRSFGLTTGQIGTWFAVVYGIGGLLGAYVSGELASRYAANNERLQLKGVSLAMILTGILSTCIYLSPTAQWAFAFAGLMMFVGVATTGPLFATMQVLVPGNMRAVAFALTYLVANLIGMGFGPLAAGALSDALRPWAGEESVRYALLVLSPGYGWAAWHVWRARRTVERDLEMSDETQSSTDRTCGAVA